MQRCTSFETVRGCAPTSAEILLPKEFSVLVFVSNRLLPARGSRYFDATAHAEFLYECVEQTVDQDLPQELAYLEAYDRFSAGIQAMVDMPDRKVNLLHRFLNQGKGQLSKRSRTNEFAALTDEEVLQIEELYREKLAGISRQVSEAPE